MRGNIEQRDFSIGSVQCTSMSVIFAAKSFISNPNNWTANDIDNILIKGNEYYQEITSLPHIKSILEKYNTQYLNIEDVIGVISLDERTKINVDLENKMNNFDQHYSNSFKKENFFISIDWFVHNFNFAVLTLYNYTFALINLNNSLFFCNSHSCDYNGKPANIGTACVLKFDGNNRQLEFCTYFFQTVFHPLDDDDTTLICYSLEPLSLFQINNNENLVKRDLSDFTLQNVVSTNKKLHIDNIYENDITMEDLDTIVETTQKLKKSLSFDASNLNEFFLTRIPAWGGEFLNYKFINTCCFDYFLYALWLTSHLSSELNRYLFDNNTIENNIHIKDIINMIELNNWHNAKYIWLVLVCKKKPIKNVIDCLNNVNEIFSKHLEYIQQYALSTCSNVNCRGNRLISKYNSRLEFSRKNEKIILNLTDEKYTCTYCHLTFLRTYRFKNEKKPFLIININEKIYLKWEDLPKILKFENNIYKLLFINYYIAELNHFKSIFTINDKTYFIDDLNININSVNVKETAFKVDTCFYYLT